MEILMRRSESTAAWNVILVHENCGAEVLAPKRSSREVGVERKEEDLDASAFLQPGDQLVRRSHAETQPLALLIRKFPRLRPRGERSSHRSQVRLSPFPRRLLEPRVLAAQMHESVEFSPSPGRHSLSSEHHELVISLEISYAEEVLHWLTEHLGEGE